MFKWKVSGLGGGGGGKSKAAKNGTADAKLNNASEAEKKGKNAGGKEGNSGNSKDKSEADHGNSKGGFRFFGGGNSSSSLQNNNSKQQQQPAQQQQQQQQQHPPPPPPNGILKNAYDANTLSRVGQRLAMNNVPSVPSPGTNNNTTSNSNLAINQQLNLSNDHIYTGDNRNHQMAQPQQLYQQHQQHQHPPAPMPKPGWRGNGNSNNVNNPNPEEAIPSDSLYGNRQQQQIQDQQPHQQQMYQPRTSATNANLAHWSSHGYLSKPPGSSSAGSPQPPPLQSPNSTLNSRSSGLNDSGYVLLKRQGDQMVVQSASSSQQPQSLQSHHTRQMMMTSFGDQQPIHDADRKYFSVRGFSDMKNKHQTDGGMGNQSSSDANKYFSVDARYNSVKNNLPPDLKLKLKQVQEAQQYRQQLLQQQEQQPSVVPPHQTYGQQQAPPPPPRPGMDQPNKSRQQQQTRQPPNKPMVNGSNNGSVSWLEWTQQLQAYIAWVNSQLRKRPDLKPVQDLRTDLQSGEVLAQLIEIISGEQIVGIEYNPESLQGMRENLERILKFMTTKRIRMHQISSREILEGNLKAVMRLILALAAHYKPQSVRHHDASGAPTSYESSNNCSSQTIVNHASGSTKAPPPSRQAVNNNKIPLHPQPPKVPPMTSKNPPEQLDDTQLDLNQTDANISLHNESSLIRRTASLNSRSSSQPPQSIYENYSKEERKQKQNATTMECISTQTEAKSPLQQQKELSLQREGSFVRTGSGRKLPKIPSRNTHADSAPTSLRSHSFDANSSRNEETNERQLRVTENRKSRPKALEFWESLATTDRRKDGETEHDDIECEDDEATDFRYNTIHRMSSMGRRMLPKPPPSAAARSQSLDRNGDLAAAFRSNGGDENSLNSSFASSSGHASLPPSTNNATKSPSPPTQILENMQSSSSKEPAVVSAGQPSPPSSADSRGEVEGSSDNNNSPPTSVIQGLQGAKRSSGQPSATSNPALDWLRGNTAFGNANHHREKNGETLDDVKESANGCGFSSLDEEDAMVVSSLYHMRAGDGNSSSSKQSDSLSDEHTTPVVNAAAATATAAAANVEALLHDLTQAKRQLMELHSLLLTNIPSSTICEETLAERLRESRFLASELERIKKDFRNGSSLSSIKQSLLQTTLARQTLEHERKEMLQRIQQLEDDLDRERKAKSTSNIMNGGSHSSRFEDFVRRKTQEGGGNMILDTDFRALYEEELAVARDAISNLRTSFNDSDPNQHILDTLEQCISVIIEKIQTLELQQQQQEKSSSRLSSLDYARINDVPTSPCSNTPTAANNNNTTAPSSISSVTANSMTSNNHPPTTKILYFTSRSVTPFMSTVNKRIGEVTLRDFKNLFDRPGFFRFHFKTVDQEFGMVKEEITQDDTILPGTDGKIVVWVDED